MKKNRCGQCEYLKYTDAEGLGWCSLLEEADVDVKDEACVEFEEREEKELEEIT